MRKALILIISAVFFVLLASRGVAQQTDSLAIPPAQQPPDSLIILDSNVVRHGWLSKDYPNPKKAALLSLIVPGAGQVYNKKLWYVKVPVIYGALGGMVYAINFNQSNYRDFKKAYTLKLQDKPHKFSGTNLDDARVLKVLRDAYDKNTQLSYIGLVAVYALQSVEAFVAAHLNNFDISNDLSMQVNPQFNTDFLTGAPAPGIGIAFRFE